MKDFWARFDRIEPQFLIAFAVMSLFAFAYTQAPQDETLRGALIAAFSASWGYYLGSSNGAKAANTRADKAIDVASQAVEKKQ